MCEELKRVIVFLILNIFTNVLVLATGNQVKGSANQSSQYRTCSAEKAFDGETIFHESESRCTCSATAVRQIPRWWEMNFGSKHLIGSIKVIGRDGFGREQSQSLAAYISNDTMETNSGTVVHLPDSNTIGLIVQFNHAPRVAQYINIKKDGANDVMTICEVEVFGAKCPSGYFGDMCVRRCHCKNQCEVISGHCTECEPGWKPPTCETACHSGFYDDCKQVCGNCKQPPCNKIDGYCTGGCAEGFAGDKCDQECPTGRYGDYCSRNCSQHCIAEECHRVNGMCNHGCKPGYNFQIDPKCETHYKEERMFTVYEVAGVAGVSVAGCLLLLGLVFACILGYRRYKSASKERDTTNVIPDIDYVNTGRAYEGPNEVQLQNSDEHIYQTIQN
ncbi:protein draper-like isoform X1 [Mya arenaria]|uniref:protein draper-like isoform X1 n=1 Tax=Mya arenaria TaxID=6604 RepID=UPI0022E94303|nr:protein draper-like isoform X1 [Mya arenaria]